MVSQENIRKNIKPIVAGASALILIAVLVPTLTLVKSPTDASTTETSNNTKGTTPAVNASDASPRTSQGHLKFDNSGDTVKPKSTIEAPTNGTKIETPAVEFAPANDTLSNSTGRAIKNPKSGDQQL